MISLSIKDVKLFMSHLLIKDTFDSFLLSEADISTANNFIINGNINKDFFSSEEYEELDNKNYSLWSKLKPFCFSLIKGSKVPSSMKIIFLFLTASVPIYFHPLTPPWIHLFQLLTLNGLFMNIRYQDGQLTIITGSSLKVFTLDKSIDNAFDKYVCRFLSDAGISFEEE